MKKMSQKYLGIAGLVLVALPMVSFAGIKGSKHDMTSGGAGTSLTSDAGTEICAFCHTPHASNTAVQAPLWNKGVMAANTYTTYSQTNSSTIDGTVNLGGISLACLSCHDGTQAMDNMVNQPGSGGYNSGGLSAGYTWVGGTADGMMTAGVFNLGKDLQNDHPISIPYCGGGDPTNVAANCADKDFNNASTATVGGTAVFWVEAKNAAGAAATAAGRQKQDLMLYGRGGVQYVECASCHDPHNTTNATFLRTTNTSSAVCLTCHNK